MVEEILDIQIPQKRPHAPENPVLANKKRATDTDLVPAQNSMQAVDVESCQQAKEKRALLSKASKELPVILSAEEKAQIKATVSSSISKVLPIARHKEEIINKLRDNRVVIISGDTGCGKTTQVPKYILESGDDDVKIICTQPRRLAAINIAKRVAEEIHENVGRTIGYHVGMQRKKTKGVTKVTFMTTGIFLMRLVNNPESLKTYTHLIMDEVHERDLDIDFSLVVVKHLLSKGEENLKFKLILMSATFNTNLFANYFARSSVSNIEQVNAYAGAEEAYREQDRLRQLKHEAEWHPCSKDEWNADGVAGAQGSLEDIWIDERIVSNNQAPVAESVDKSVVIEINARMFEVSEFYLDAIVQNIKSQSGFNLSGQDREILQECLEFAGTQKPMVKEGAMRVASIIICDIIGERNAFNDSPNELKSILVFLPGLAEILQFMDYIREFYQKEDCSNSIFDTLDFIPLHSSLNEDEQDRAFRQAQYGRRKVIIATNIAESSITIPDVKYVIDFMLTKELYYDPVSKSESLQLNWCSKASAKQRMGRAGRVASGIVFRLCTQTFFDQFMPDYPKPEMQRCPLEKLILQIKLWDRYEPDEILGRAIQPPELRDIFNAIKNLQQTGALTIPPPILTENGKSMSNQNEKYKPKITALGKIFVNLPCDLKITRIFLFGMVLKCMSQAIDIGAIHSQTRSIFRRGGDPVKTTKLQCLYDDKRDSDSIMLLRVYQEWVQKFHPYLYKEKEEIVDTGDDNEQSKRNRGDGKRVFIRRPQFVERKWCMDRGLDLNILREVATLAEEIRHRFLRMNISTQCLNSRVRLRSDNPDAELILKTCIGGAFYSKYVKAAYKNDDMLMRMKNSKFFDADEAKHSLILNTINDQISEQSLRMYFQDKFNVPVSKISVQSDKPTIVFGPEILQRGIIKACFKLGLRRRFMPFRRMGEKEFQDSKQFRSSILSDGGGSRKMNYLPHDQAIQKLENEELRRPNYLFELRFENVDNVVDFDTDSINNFTMETDPNKLQHITYACQDFYDKGGRFLCRNSTKLPDVPMVNAIFCLIYAPVVQVMADENKTYFKKLICDNGEQVVKLTHVLTHYDLEIAQRVRNMLNESLCDEVKQKQAHLGTVESYVKKLLAFKRISVDVYVKLQVLKEEETKQDNKKMLETLDKQAVAAAEENFFLTEEEKGVIEQGKGFEDVTMNDEGEIIMDRQARYEEECEKGYFLQPIYVQKIQQKIYLYDSKVTDMLKEFQDRIQRKRSMIEKNNLKCKEFALKDTMVICERCKSDLAPLKTFDYESHEFHYAKCVFGSFRKITFEEAKHQDYADDHDFVDLYAELWDEEKRRKPGQQMAEHAFCECAKKHIVGIVIGQKYYLTEISQVQLMFPGGHYDRWEEHLEPGYKKAFNLQDKLNYQRAEVIKISQERNGGWSTQQAQARVLQQPVECELCNHTCSDPQDFIGHCRKDPTHLRLQKKFTDETYDFLFDLEQFAIAKAE